MYSVKKMKEVNNLSWSWHRNGTGFRITEHTKNLKTASRRDYRGMSHRRTWIFDKCPQSVNNTYKSGWIASNQQKKSWDFQTYLFKIPWCRNFSSTINRQSSTCLQSRKLNYQEEDSSLELFTKKKSSVKLYDDYPKIQQKKFFLVSETFEHGVSLLEWVGTILLKEIGSKNCFVIHNMKCM